MPQIWPMNWILLMVFFISVFLLFISLVYFNSLNLGSSSNLNSMEKHSSELLSWKW